MGSQDVVTAAKLLKGKQSAPELGPDQLHHKTYFRARAGR